MKQHFKYIFAKIIRLSNSIEVNQTNSHRWYFHICQTQNICLTIFFACNNLSLLLGYYGPKLLCCFCFASTERAVLSMKPLPAVDTGLGGLYSHARTQFNIPTKFLFWMRYKNISLSLYDKVLTVSYLRVEVLIEVHYSCFNVKEISIFFFP